MITALQQFVKDVTYKPDFLLIIFAFFLPVFPQVAQVAIALYLISWIINKQFRYLSKVKSNWFAIGSMAYFIIFALSGLYSTNLQFWSSDLEAKLPLLLVPLLLVSREKYDERILKAIFWAFVGGCLIIVGVLYYQYYLGDGNVFRSTVSGKTFLNPIYFAMFLSGILLTGLYFLFDKEKIEINQKVIFQGLGLLFIHYIVFALASRMAILATIAVELGIVFLWQIIFKKQFIKGVSWLVIVIVINLLSLNFIKQASKRMSKTSSGEVRMLIWEASILQISKSPIFGYGSGDSRSAMTEGYQIVDYAYGIKYNQNCHNQYFETGISTGLIGILVLLGWFLLAFKMGWQTQNYLLCIFLVIIALNILTESMLERQQGTYFVAFFGSLLTWKSWKNE